jgi:hypothetical protein
VNVVYSERTVKAARKRRLCQACGSFIDVGETYLQCNSVEDGEFYSAGYHHECRAEEIRLNQENGLYTSDEWMTLHEHITEGRIPLQDLPTDVARRFEGRINPNVDKEKDRDLI